MSASPSRRFDVFQLVLFGSLLFIPMTGLAMLLYAGGTNADKSTTGYLFLANYFSDLGRTRAHNGQPNMASMALFMTALTLAGAALAVFFVAFARFFTDSPTLKGFSWLGSAWGVISGLCFIGIAWTPANVLGEAHGDFVLWAFRTFLFAVSTYAFVILASKRYPKLLSLIFFGFAALLAGYIWLITQGPDDLTIQVIGQKVIVYASIISVGAQAFAAHRQLQKHENSTHAL